MQEPVMLDQRTADQRLLNFVMTTPRWFFTWSGGLGFVFMLGAVVFLTMLYWGLEFLGYSHPVYWGFLIVNSCSGSVSRTPAYSSRRSCA